MSEIAASTGTVGWQTEITFSGSVFVAGSGVPPRARMNSCT